MKTKIAIILLTVGAFVVTGCAGTQTAVNRFGNTQPNMQVLQPPVNSGVIEPEIRPFGQMPYTFGFYPGSLTLFNGTQLMQKPLEVTFPFNQDASLTLFRFNNLQFKIMPMMNGKF